MQIWKLITSRAKNFIYGKKAHLIISDPLNALDTPLGAKPWRSKHSDESLQNTINEHINQKPQNPVRVDLELLKCAVDKLLATGEQIVEIDTFTYHDPKSGNDFSAIRLRLGRSSIPDVTALLMPIVTNAQRKPDE